MSSFITLLGYIKDVTSNKSVYVDKISKITDLNLNCLAMQTQLELTVTSSEGFTIFSHLVSLNISGIIINENVANWFVKAFDNNLNLEQLFLNKCQITTAIMKLFYQQLKFNSLVKAFEVAENFIDDEAVEELAMTILHWNSLKYIKLARNLISTQCMLLLEMLTEDLELQTIMSNNYFRDNHYVVKSFIKVLDYASNHNGERVTQFPNNFTQIRELSLQVLTPLEMTLHASNILKKTNNMISLNLSGIITSEQVANNLCGFFNNNQNSLKYVIMNHCQLDSNKILRFAHKFKSTVYMEEAQFCNNKIDDEVTKPLVISILHWNIFQILELENNCFTESSIRIYEILKELSKLCDLSIDFSGKINKIIPFITMLEYMMEVEIQDSVLVENISNANKLLLDCSEQNNTNVQLEITASMFFTRFVNLTELNVSGITISEKEVADNLANTFDSNLHSLEHFIMNNCQLTSSIVTNLIRKLPSCVDMRELQLSNNFLNDEIAETLIVLILYLNELQLLTLEQNCFSKRYEKVFHFLTKYLNFSDSVINLNDNMDSIIAFITLLEYMQSISVNISNFVDNVSKVEILSLDCSKLNTSVEE